MIVVVFFHIKRYIQILPFLAVILMTSCVRDVFTSEPVDTVKFGYMKIRLDAPESHIPTKSMNAHAERAIDQTLLNILVFNHKNGDEKFCYKATVSESVIYDENNKSAIVTVRLTKSASPDDLYRIVVIANYDLSGIDMIENITTKAEVLEQLIFSVPGKWNTDSDNYTPFPMWGENVPVVISDNMSSSAINLYRALSGIDVGLNFAMDNGKLTDHAYGIQDFKLAEVLVFRTYDKGHVAPLNDAVEIPDVPQGALRHSDNFPLSYIIPEAGGVNSYIREIYVPEADLPLTPGNDNIHCIVIGGYYSNSSTVSYYRLDFAKETGTYLPILRNHRYVFNIIQVTGPGFTSVIPALESVPVVGNVSYDLIAWDATIHEMETQGKYYFGIDNRDLLAEAQSTSSAPDNKFTVKYQTNYPLSAADPIRLEWASIADDLVFDAQWQANGKNILITVNNDNLTNSLLSDTLYVYAGPFIKKIVVRQKCFDVKYSIDCSSIAVSGAYKQGITLNPSLHYIKLSITADNRSMQGRSYVIETTDPNNHGISFRVEGIFDFRNIPEGAPLRIDNIRMAGSGILQSSRGMFSLPVISDSPTGSSCTATIQLVIPHMTVLVIASPDEYGCAISDRIGGASKIFNSPNNFGQNENSIVKVEGFSFISTSIREFQSFYTENLDKWLTGIGNNGKIADIVYLANYVRFNNYNTTVNLLVDYMDKGGVVVVFNEEISVRNLVNAVLNVNNISGSYQGSGGSIYPFPANSYFGSNENVLQDVMNRFESDPILNGPFGDVRDKQWGEDINDTMTLSNMPNDSCLTIYSYQIDISANKPAMNKTHVNGFKYESEERNMIWFGDGGFMSSLNGQVTNYNNSFPFNWNTVTFFPEPKANYGALNRKPVYNSIVFSNIMAWAIKKSDSLREKRENAE